MTDKKERTFWVKLYLSGPIEVAKQIIRKDALTGGLCVTIEPTTFIYNGGEESGYVVGLLNYPRFPNTPGELMDRARKLAASLLEGTYQRSYSIMNPSTTEWHSIV